MSDPRKAKGKRHSLVTLIILAKLCNQDTPVAIADWAKNHAEELAELLKLRQSWMPHHNTHRRMFQEIISEAEFGQMMQKYHQQPTERPEDTLATDGKTLRGTRIVDQERGDRVLSVYAGQSQRVVAQEVVDIKENEIVAAPKALEQVSVAGKIITGDAMHTQRDIRNSADSVLALSSLKRLRG